MTGWDSVRTARLDRISRAARRLPDVLPGVVAVGLAGSYARHQARPDSDVDLVVLTERPAALLDGSAWFEVFASDAVLVRSGNFGAIRERRLLLPDSTVVEVGVGTPAWASTDPIDAGTRRVVSDGFVVLYDPNRILAALVYEVAKCGAG